LTVLCQYANHNTVSICLSQYRVSMLITVPCQYVNHSNVSVC